MNSIKSYKFIERNLDIMYTNNMTEIRRKFLIAEANSEFSE